MLSEKKQEATKESPEHEKQNEIGRKKNPAGGQVIVDSPQLEENDFEQPERGLNFFTILVLTTAILGGLVFGLDIGTTSTTSMNPFREAMNIPILNSTTPQDEKTTQQLSLFAVLFHLFSLIGAPFSGILSDRFGRKPVIIISATLFLLGAIWQSLAGLLEHSFAWTSILLGRCLGGVGNGFILTIMPTYCSELAPSSWRGKIIIFFQLAITIGILAMALINDSIQYEDWGWRVAIVIQCIPCLIIILMTVFVLPESPRYLMKINQSEKARSALNKLAKGTPDAEKVVNFEMEEMAEEIADMEQVGEATFKEMFSGTNLMPLLCGVMVAFSQQVTGVNWFMNYATVLFSNLQFNPFEFDIILKSVNCIATFAALFCVDRFGRLWLTQWGTALTIIIFLLIALVIYGSGVDITAASDPGSETAAIQLFCVIMIYCFQVVYAIFWGGPGWLVPGEVMPLRIRSKGMALAVAGNMFGNIVFGDYGYVNCAASIGLANTMIVVVFFNILLVMGSVVFLQPETKGLTIEEMRWVFRYEKGGDPVKNHGTIRQCLARNFRQSLQIFACRTIDTKADVAEFVLHHEQVLNQQKIEKL